LVVGGVAAPRIAAATALAISNTPPQIVEIAPGNGQSVNNNRPSIYATFRTPVDVGIDASSVAIDVNGLDVSASSTRTDQFVTYSPNVPLGDGAVSVTVRVSDRAGNTATRSWSFVVRTR
jgi:hypothetical protein